MTINNEYNMFSQNQLTGQEIAIIGMAGRFPGASTVDELWENIKSGKESITFFSDEELKAAGLPPELLARPNYVRGRGILDEIEYFDANIFGFTPREAEILDPQQRVFLECAWQALEHAGYDTTTYQKSVGVYAGSSINTYLYNNLHTNKILSTTISPYQLFMSNSTDFLTTRTSYKLNLKGPSIAVQTGCSTSLVTVHMACQSLLAGECEMALAGGVAISVPQRQGYLYEEGGIGSPDGHCRAFDAQAHGTVGGEGVGIVVLKRLEDALTDSDTIHAIIKGTAVNNDGNSKIGYTAPSVSGQVEVIRAAHFTAEVDPATITYVEAHGTGTPLGDPIEVTALNQAFKSKMGRNESCALGSIKTNIGHLDAAAGIAGLIKTVLALKYQQIPPSLHFQKANPQIAFQDGPFYVNTVLSSWQPKAGPRRAGVSSFGIGGTNAHIVLEEASAFHHASLQSDPSWQLLVLSAQHEITLDKLTQNMIHFLKSQQATLENVAYTLQVGRKALKYRRSVVCKNAAEAIELLETALASQKPFQAKKYAERSIAFLFPGQGTQYINMGRDLYEHESIFREKVDKCALILVNYLGIDIRTVLYPDPQEQSNAAKNLKQTWLTQPVLFTIEYALASLWMHWGIQPHAMIGHSIGEYVAAFLAGVFSLEDALKLVAARGRLVQQQPEGIMIAVPLSTTESQSLVNNSISLAATNAPNLQVLSGPIGEMQALMLQLDKRNIRYKSLHTSHAFHSSLMDPILGSFANVVRQIHLLPPKIRYISNVSGTWITDIEATDPEYWVHHLRYPVQFASGVQALNSENDWLMIEIGPGNTLSALARQNVPSVNTFKSLHSAQEQQSDIAFILHTIGKLWESGANQINWNLLHVGPRFRIPLPMYPFNRQRFWVEASQPDFTFDKASLALQPHQQKKANIAEWFYIPSWESTPLNKIPLSLELHAKDACWLLFQDSSDLSHAIFKHLDAAHAIITTVTAGEQFTCHNKSAYTINFAFDEDYINLLSRLQESGRFPSKIIYVWAAAPSPQRRMINLQDIGAQTQGFYGLLYLAQALGKQILAKPIQIWCISSEVYRVTGNEHLNPMKATLLGACKTIPQEYPQISCGYIDVALDSEIGWDTQTLGIQILTEMLSQSSPQIVAYRDGQRWTQCFKPHPLQGSSERIKRLRPHGNYVITGGLGGIGLALADGLASQVRAHLFLFSRSAFPERAQWQPWLEEHPMDNDISQKIRKIQTIEARGSQVFLFQADVADLEYMRSLFDSIRNSWGDIHGVIHAAGVAGGGAIQLKQREEVERVWAAKVKGTLVLAHLFSEAQKPLDFFILCSSLSSIVGGFGQADYCAANNFLDALAQTSPVPYSAFTCSINWDVFQDTGMAVHTMLPENLQAQRISNLKHGVTAREGTEAFLRVLSDSYAQFIVSTRDIDIVIASHISQFSQIKQEQINQQVSRTLDVYERPHLSNAYTAPGTALELQISSLWSKYLGIEHIGLNDNFFDLGGHSLIMAQIHNELQTTYGYTIALVDLLAYPTVNTLAKILAEQQKDLSDNYLDKATKSVKENREYISADNNDIAIIGMAGRFPGAKDIELFWQNIKNGVECITFFTNEELQAEGVDQEQLQNPSYVKAGAILEDIELFDAAFFRYSPREAEGIDPQQRLFLECAWQALEHAGYDPVKFGGNIGVYAGLSMNTYLLFNIQNNPDLIDSSQFMMGNVNDFLATRVSYKLDLRGPAMTVQTACSTGLVAVHLAAKSLKEGTCDLALAGAASVRALQKRGYLYEKDGIVSPDGHSRTFDAQAQGTLFGNGVGIVVLKRLSDAVAGKDTIYAVIKGHAINNDGSMKVGFTAPSIQGQADVITQALQSAHISSETISYVEAHGTGTALGDPVEIAALTKAFRQDTQRNGFCAIGSIKTNIGHLETAAGIAGLVKAALALKNKELPPSLHFQQSNPNIDFAHTPFYVNTQLRPWFTDSTPRRAGVSAFGLGGTNAHLILEEAPVLENNKQLPVKPWYVISLSAKTDSALQSIREQLAMYLQQHSELVLPNVSYTLHLGRQAFAHRLFAVCQDTHDAITVLQTANPARIFRGQARVSPPSIAFMFPGGGVQYDRMGYDLYQHEKRFRETIDECVNIFNRHLPYDLKDMLYPDETNQEKINQQLHRPTVSLPTIFATEYALAQLLISWGIQPQAMIGHSLGEYVAACLAGVFSLEDAITLVALRSHLLEEASDGAMLSISLSEQEVLPWLNQSLSLAAINSPTQCVVAGVVQDIEVLEYSLENKGVEYRRLHISAAAHSALLDPILHRFADFMSSIQLRPPNVPFVSNISGTWISADEACNPSYWVSHLRHTVRFSQGVSTLSRRPNQVLLEVGPGHTLSGLVREQTGDAGEMVILTTLRHTHKQISDVAFLLTTVGRLWLSGVEVNWLQVYGQVWQRIALPTYPFERRRYWIDPRRKMQTFVQSSDAEKQNVFTGNAESCESVDLNSTYSATYIAPRNDVESTIATVWQEILGVKKISIYDNYFELGGHSLLAVKIAARLRAVLHIELPLRDLLAHPSIAELASHIIQTIEDHG